eukprot:XP_017455533.1 PREDICTED: uncharacterized protein LOC290876 isoform X5 [Rattus norvegicus]
MEKDPVTHRKHRPGPGALPSGITPVYLKVASEGAELQRSRSVGGLHQKGDPPICIRKLLRKELDSEDQSKDPRNDTDDGTCQASLEDDKKKGSHDEVGKPDKCEKMDPEKSDSEASAAGPQDDASKERCLSVAEEEHPESMTLDNLLEKQARTSHFSHGSSDINHLCLWRSTWATILRRRSSPVPLKKRRGPPMTQG